MRCSYDAVGKLSIGFGLFALIAAANAHSAGTHEAITVGQRFTIESKVLNETRRYFVHTPYKYRLRSDRYPVLVVLDGYEHFAHTSATVDFLSRNDRIPQMIVVGILNTERERDMRIWSPQEASRGTAKQFLSFIADELLPAIDKSYRTHPYRVLVGHSLGGAYAVYALQNRPDVFDAYLAISPSFWQNKESLLTDFGPFLKSHPSLKADLFMASERAGDPYVVSMIDRVSGILTANAPAGLRWTFSSYHDEDHLSVPYRSTQDGLKQLFDGWFIVDPLSVQDKSGLAGLEAHYANVSQRMGYTVSAPQTVAAALFNSLMEKGRINEAEELVQKAFLWYSAAPVVNQAAMMVYSAKRDEPRVVEHAKKLLAINPGSEDARDVLKDKGIDVAQLIPEPRLSPGSFNAFVGVYSNADALIEVSIRNEELFATTDAGRFKLKALTTSSFYAVDGAMKITFLKDRKNKVTGLSLDYLTTPNHSTAALTKVR